MPFDDSQTSEFVRDNIVKITDKSKNFYGTGFFLEVAQKKYCVTCHHCICRLDQIFIEKDDKIYLCNWMEYYSDMNKDIAVLTSDNCPVSPLRNNKQTMAKLPVFVWGYSARNINIFPQGSPVENGNLSGASFLFRWNEEKVSGTKKWQKKPQVSMYVYQFEGNFDLGFSGARVCYDGDKKVVGIFTAKDDHYGYVITIQTLLEKFNLIENISKPQRTDTTTTEFLNSGNSYLLNKKYDRAMEEYDRIINDPNYINALNNKGFALVRLSKYSEAIKWLDKALTLDAESSHAWNNKGWALHYLNRYDEAVECYDRALKLDPYNVDILNLRGWALRRLGRHEEAIKWLDKALEIDPNYVQALNNKALSLNTLSRYSEAIKWLDKALEIDPNYPDVLNNKGWALNGLKRYSEAIKWLDKALEIEPNHKYALDNKRFANQKLKK